MNIKKIILLGIITIFSLGAMAQSETTSADEDYNKVQALYNNGEFDKCEEEALRFVNSKKGLVKTSTYRCLALCRIALGDITGAREYVAKLLKYDPYFNASLGDPQRFIDIINESKNQEAGITTASRQAESLDEAPVPVTLITEEMIQHSGCTNLQQLLCLYVPGMTLAEGAESNIAMHGIYSLMQDKILIMIDGHRLNSSSTNAEAPDYRTSLDRVKQIEVLRGPASSLYGNVALTAVVNIITHKGAAMNGGRISALAGTQHTLGASIVVGGGNNVVDIMGWGSIFSTRGFPHNFYNGFSGDNTVYSQGYRDRPSYDIGMKGRWRDFTLSLNLQRSKRTPYLNIFQISNKTSLQSLENLQPHYNTYRNYNYDQYEAVDGNKPGVTRANTRINIDYSHSFEKFDVQAAGYINFEKTSLYNVLGDSIDRGIAEYMMLLLVLDQYTRNVNSSNANSAIVSNLLEQSASTRGVFQNLSWTGVTYGLQAQILTKYSFLGNGSIVFGGQFDIFSLSNSSFILGGSYSAANAISSTAMFLEGQESSISSYLQLKHYFTPRLIINAGIRYDHKSRFNDDKLDRFSPRFSVIYKLSKRLSLRGNYNYSFVDAAYIYRACNMGFFSGGVNMQPETMHGFNLGATYTNKEKHFTAELGAFYNILNDLVVLNPDLHFSEDFTTDMTTFVNAGKVRMVGIDGSAQYSRSRFFANTNATWQRVVSSDDYIVVNHETFSTPALHINATVSGAPYKGKGTGFFKGGTLWVRGTAQFQTATYYKVVDLTMKMFARSDCFTVERVAPQLVAGLGVTYDWKHLDIDLSLNNVFNKDYKIGSMLTDGIPRSGRSFIGKLTFKF